MTTPNPYRRFRFPAEVIEHAVWLCHCFSLSLRGVELILAARGIVVSHESMRDWGLRFGQMFANALKRRRPRPGDKWFMGLVNLSDHGHNEATIWMERSCGHTAAATPVISAQVRKA